MFVTRRWPAVLVAMLAVLALGFTAWAADGKFVTVNLTEQFNNDGISFIDDPLDGDLDFFKTTLPAEALPASGSMMIAAGIPFVFPPKENGQLNNIASMARDLPLPAGNYAAVHMMVTATNGSKKGKFGLVYEDGSLQETSLSINAAATRPKSRDKLALETSYMHDVIGRVERPARLWVYSLAADPQKKLVALRLPDVFDIHIFALTLEKAE